MDIDEAKLLRIQLEEKIHGQLVEFSKQTGLHVADVNITRDYVKNEEGRALFLRYQVIVHAEVSP